MRVQSPIAGGQSGSVGGLVFQTYHGRTYARSKPTIFHYGPTPAQAAAQAKFYPIFRQCQDAYKAMRSFIPASQRKQVNPFNDLLSNVFKALETYSDASRNDTISKFGFDAYERVKVEPGDYTEIIVGNSYIVTYNDIEVISSVNFKPLQSHALLLNKSLQRVIYRHSLYEGRTSNFVFPVISDRYGDTDSQIFIALSDNENFTNFFV